MVCPPSFYRREGKERGGGAPPLPSSLSKKRQEGWRPSSFHLIGLAAIRGAHQPMWANVFPFLWPLSPIDPPDASGTPSGDPITFRCISKPFWRPNAIVLYINLYLRTIPEILMSVITSGTPNNIRSPNHISHIIPNRHRTLSVRTLLFRE